MGINFGGFGDVTKNMPKSIKTSFRQNFSP